MDIASKLLSDIGTYKIYSKFIEHLSRRESLPEIINRNMTMNLDRFPKLSTDIIRAYKLIHELKVMPSMRSLQFGGTAILKNQMRGYNCSYAPIQDTKVFSEALFLLLSGVGFGFSVQKHHTNQLPKLQYPRETGVYVIHDSIAGWAEALNVLLEAYFYGKIRPEFDLSKIRAKGSPLITTGAKAPGPEPLKIMLHLVEEKLQLAIGRKLKPIEVHDIVCIISDSVLAGGTRRCLPEGSRVHTEEGIIPIEDVIIGQKVLTTEGYKKIKAKLNQGEQQTIKIKTQNGNLECTPNHRVAVLESIDGDYKWVEAGNLKIGDRLYFNNIETSGTITKLPDNDFIVSPQAHTLQRITIPELDTNIAWLIGLIHGDGYISVINDGPGKRHGKVEISCSNDYPKIKQKAIEQLSRFGVRVVLSKGDGNLENVKAHSVELAFYLSKIKKPNTSLEVPEFIFKASPQIRAAYLAGLMDADGCEKTRPVVVVSQIYPEYLKQCQELLSSLGIASRLKLVRSPIGNWKALYNLSVCSRKQLLKLKSTVGNYGHKCNFNIPENKQQYSYSFPSDIINKSKKFQHRGKIINTSVESVEKEIGELPFTPVKVLGFLDGRTVNTWDIEIEDKPEFFTNGYLVHNSALISLFDKGDNEMLTAKQGAWWEKHPYRCRANNSAVLERYNTSKEEFDYVFQMTKDSGSGEPGFSWANNRDVGRNPCVSGDTEILTKDGYRRIDSLVDLEIDIWNGFEWSNVTPKITGSNQEMLKITFNDGRTLSCTKYHKFHIIKNYSGKASEVDAVNLKIGMKLIKHRLPILSNKNILDDAYTQGFISAEGMELKKIVYVYKPKEMCLKRLQNIKSLVWEEKHSRYRVSLQKIPVSKNMVPINYSINSKLEWLAGLLDGDGTELKEGGIQLVSVNKDFILNLQKLLSTLGIQSKVAHVNKAGNRNMPDHKGGSASFFCKDSFRICIGAKQAQILKSLGLNCERLNLKKSPQRDASQFIKVVKIESNGIANKVYCFNESKRHLGLFNGVITGQCAEIALRPFSFCNLTSVNQTGIKDKKDFLNRIYAASLLGTLQASYTDFHYLRPIWKETTELDALLGISFTGIADSNGVVSADWLTEGALHAVEVNKKYANKLGINSAARVTTTKPEGSCSVVVGSSSGIHARHASFYIRRIRMNKNDALASYLKNVIPELVEDDFTSATGVVVSIPQKSPKGSITRYDETAMSLLDRTLLYNRNWIAPGHISGDDKHNVSVTISVKDNEWDELRQAMWDNRADYGGISLLPFDGGSYKQAPFEDCTEEEYNKMLHLVKEIDLSKVKETEDNTTRVEQLACAGGVCIIE